MTKKERVENILKAVREVQDGLKLTEEEQLKRYGTEGINLMLTYIHDHLTVLKEEL